MYFPDNTLTILTPKKCAKSKKPFKIEKAFSKIMSSVFSNPGRILEIANGS